MAVSLGVPTLNTKCWIALEPTTAGVPTWGTAPAGSAFHVHPANTINASNPFDVLPDNGYRGFASRTFAEYQGVGHSETSLESAFYPEESGYFSKLILGTDAVTGAGPFTHTMSLGPTPESLSFIEGGFGSATDAAYARQYTGNRVTQVSYRFTGSQGLFSQTVNLYGKIWTDLAQGATAMATNTTDVTTGAIEAWRSLVGIAGPASGGTLVADIVEAEVTMKREILPRWGLNNSQDPTAIYVGPLDVSFSMTIDVNVANHKTWRDYFRNFTPVQIQLIMTKGTKVFKFNMQNAIIADGFEVDRSSPVNLMYHVTGHALHNSTDVGPAVITLTNAQTTYAT